MTIIITKALDMDYEASETMTILLKGGSNASEV
jgi:hypothetical protein